MFDLCSGNCHQSQSRALPYVRFRIPYNYTQFNDDSNDALINRLKYMYCLKSLSFTKFKIAIFTDLMRCSVSEAAASLQAKGTKSPSFLMHIRNGVV